MEPAAAGPGPLIVNNKQPQPPPPPPPGTAQPPPGAPRAAGGLLPGGKAREFNRNQRKDSEVRAAGGRGWHRAGGRGGPGAGAASGPGRASRGLDRGPGSCHFTENRAVSEAGRRHSPGEENPESCHKLRCGPGRRSWSWGRPVCPGAWPEAQPSWGAKWVVRVVVSSPSFPASNGRRVVGDAGWQRRDPGEFSRRLEQRFSLQCCSAPGCVSGRESTLWCPSEF